MHDAYECIYRIIMFILTMSQLICIDILNSMKSINQNQLNAFKSISDHKA